MCRQFAYERNGGAAGAQSATNNAAGTALLGTAIGAGLGMALGSLSGQAGAGAAIGGAQRAGADLQQEYDASYTQCMYSHGNSVQNPPGGYRPGAQGPGGYGPGGYGPGGYGAVAYYGGPAVIVGTGWGWGRRPYHRRWH